jgi:hypothetical protein
MWKKFKRDFRERFLNFETAKGMYLIPTGAAIIYVTLFHIQFIIQCVGVLLGGYALFEGLRKVFVNRIKQAAAVGKLVDDRKFVP